MSNYQEIKNRVEKATPGPWVIHSHKREYNGKQGVTVDYIGTKERYDAICETDCGAYGPGIEDAEFIANARTDVPLLLKALGDVCEALANVSDLSPFIPEASDPDYWLRQAMESEK